MALFSEGCAIRHKVLGSSDRATAHKCGQESDEDTVKALFRLRMAMMLAVSATTGRPVLPAPSDDSA